MDALEFNEILYEIQQYKSVFWCFVKWSGWAHTVCVFTSNTFEEDVCIFLRFWSTHLRKGGERKENRYHTMVFRDGLLVSVFDLVHLSGTGLLRLWIDKKNQKKLETSSSEEILN